MRQRLNAYRVGIVVAACSPDSKLLASASQGSMIKLWCLNKGASSSHRRECRYCSYLPPSAFLGKVL